MPELGLKDKTVKGVGWSAIDSIAGQGVTFLVGIVLARLLSPNEYGLIGIVMIFITVLNAIVDSGFSNALIRKKDVSNDDYNTMFLTNMALSCLLYGLLFLSANAIARFFGREELVQLIRVVGVVVIINALSIVQYTILQKKLDFKTKTNASLVSSIISGVIGIVMAFMGCGVWSLAGQQIGKQVIYTFFLWISNKWRPILNFNKNSFGYMWGYGWKLLVSGLLNNIWNELYQVVVAKFYNPATLGQYTRSRQFGQIFSQNLTQIVQRVSFPVLAELQDDKEKLVAAYRKVIKVTMAVTAVSMLSLGAMAKPLIFCLIGPQWDMAATFLPLICISMSLYPLHAINLNMLQVQGRSDLFLKLEIIKKIVGVIPICIGIFIDIYWMVASGILTGIIAYFLNSYYSGRMIGYSSMMQLKDISHSYIFATVLAVAIYFLEYIPLSYYFILPIQVIVLAIVVFVVFKYSQSEEVREIKYMAGVYLKKINFKKQ